MSRVGSRCRRLVVSALLASLFGIGSLVVAQSDKDKEGATDQASQSPQAQGAKEVDPLKRPITEKQKRENAKSLKQELSKTYKKWLDERSEERRVGKENICRGGKKE